MQHLSFTFWVTKSACKPPRCVPARHSPVITLDKCLPTALPQLGLFGMEFNFIPFVEEHSFQIYRVNTWIHFYRTSMNGKWEHVQTFTFSWPHLISKLIFCSKYHLSLARIWKMCYVRSTGSVPAAYRGMWFNRQFWQHVAGDGLGDTRGLFQLLRILQFYAAEATNRAPGLVSCSEEERSFLQKC